MGETKFSVIVPAFNVAPYIEECLRSVLQQTYQDFEVIVVDDCSTDGTVDVVRGFGDSRVRLIRNLENGGVSYTRNVAIGEARGEYLVILDSDDLMAPNRLEIFNRYLESGPSDLIFDDLLYVRNGHSVAGLTAYSARSLRPSDLDAMGYSEFVQKDLGILQGMVRRGFLTEHSISYANGHSHGEDFLFYSEIFLSGGDVRFIPEALYVYCQRDASLATSVSTAYYEGFIDSTRLVLNKYESSIRGSSYERLLKARLRRQTTALGSYQATSMLKRGDIGSALSYLIRHPTIGIALGSQMTRRVSAMVPRRDG